MMARTRKTQKWIKKLPIFTPLIWPRHKPNECFKSQMKNSTTCIAENFLVFLEFFFWYFNLVEMDFKRQFWNRERFVIKYLEIFFLTLAAKWAAMIHSKYLKPFLLQFQYLNWNEYLECILDASNQKSSSFTPWTTSRLNWRPLIGSNKFREF